MCVGGKAKVTSVHPGCQCMGGNAEQCLCVPSFSMAQPAVELLSNAMVLPILLKRESACFPRIAGRARHSAIDKLLLATGSFPRRRSRQMFRNSAIVGSFRGSPVSPRFTAPHSMAAAVIAVVTAPRSGTAFSDSGSPLGKVHRAWPHDTQSFNARCGPCGHVLSECGVAVWRAPCVPCHECVLNGPLDTGRAHRHHHCTVCLQHSLLHTSVKSEQCFDQTLHHVVRRVGGTHVKLSIC